VRPAGVRLLDGACGFLEGSEVGDGSVLVGMVSWFGILCLSWIGLILFGLFGYGMGVVN
jgi:hypothetical protein